VQETSEESDQVRRIMDGGYLGKSDRLANILEYIVAEELAGRGDLIKAYSIAVDCLDRPESFDPGTDSIVRVEMGRLRRALQDYYTLVGKNDPFHIEIPKGKYQPVITRMAPDPPETTDKKTGRPNLVSVASAVLACSVLAALVYLWLPGKAQISKHPVVAIEPFIQLSPQSRSDDFFQAALETQFLREFSRFRTLRVRKVAAKDSRRESADAAEYLLSGSLQFEGVKILVGIDLFEQSSNTLRWSASFSIDRDSPNQTDLLRKEIRRVAAHIGSPDGLVAAEAIQRMKLINAETPDEYSCQLLWYAYDASKEPELEERADKCLTTLTNQNSLNSEIWSSHAFFQFLEWTRLEAETNHPLLSEALESASKSIRLDPSNPDGHEVLGSILMAQGRFETSYQSYQTARELNPSKPDLTVLVGWFRSLHGEWETGIPLVEEGIALSMAPPGWFRIPLALNFFRTGEFERSLTQAELMIASGDDRGIVLALAAALALKSDDQVQFFVGKLNTNSQTPSEALAEVQAVFDFPTIIDNYSALLASIEKI